MDRTQERAAINAAMDALEAGGKDYSADNIARLAGLPVGIVYEYVYRTGWREMGHRYSPLGFWEWK